jgi:hypothetical protein
MRAIMEAATAISTRQSTTNQDAVAQASHREPGGMLAVKATYLLSEEGRKASLLSGGDGRAVQELMIEVPANRLHLVSVDSNGVARLKLRPRFQLEGQRGVTRVDAPPTYDAPPDLDELFREAARNHQLAETFHAARRSARTRRRDVDRERRAHIAQAFLDDPNQRALVHPAPTEKRCYVSIANDRLLFDADNDDMPARLVPAEAHRRFRADLRQQKESNRQTRAAQLAVHEEKKRFVAAWISAHGTEEQQARQAAGMLPMDEAIEAIADDAFAKLGDKPRYFRDGPARLEAHLRNFRQYDVAALSASDTNVTSMNATKATPEQWAFMQIIQRTMPDANVVLREHRLALRHDPRAPGVTCASVLVTVRRGPVTLRREYDPNSV